MSSVAQKFRQSLSEGNEAIKEKIDIIDFKMVTFSLAGKEYGIDIMKVKEIARFVNFTYVPNTPSFVRGVYNLRGDIISIIDLRALFNLPFQQKAAHEEESGLILRLENNLIGVVVDKIDKVVGINSSSIQPPHPIFGDINIKFISGVVENDGKLYIILDAERVLGKDQDKGNSKQKEAAPLIQEKVQGEHEFAQYPSKTVTQDDSQYKRFISEALSALCNFTVSGINEAWFNAHFIEWGTSRPGQQVQIRTADEARTFLEPFSSPFSGVLWGSDYLHEFVEQLPDMKGNILQVWNPGCGKGYESYSLAVALRMRYPDAQIKIWASDRDLLSISGAPNLVFSERDIPDVYREWMVSGKNGLSFSQKIKDTIFFEYHDISNSHGLPPMDIIIARDILSFMNVEQCKKVLDEMRELLKKSGILVLGTNELAPESLGWKNEHRSSLVISRRDA